MSDLLEFPLPLVLNILDFLPLDSALRLGLTCRGLLDAVQSHWCPKFLSFTFQNRQRIRKQIFCGGPNSVALPSHFTHIFHCRNSALGLLGTVLSRPQRLDKLEHLRSDKRMKLHHPYFYRQLPLAVTPDWPLSEPVLNPDDIPLPHDLSMNDLMYLVLLNSKTLKCIDLKTFDTAPLPWNSTPSRVCPRDLLPHCLYDAPRPTAICVWCPDCKPAQRDHACCWQAAGAALIDHLLNLADPETRVELQTGLSGGPGTPFLELETLKFHGWGLTNFLAFLRAFSIGSFPKLKTLELGGTIIMSPGLTDTKDTDPRPALRREACPPNTCPVELNELQEKLAQVLSFHVSPYARYGYLVPLPPSPTHSTTSYPMTRSRRFPDAAVEQYWMGHFNGHLWQPSGFPVLQYLSLRVGNFDDSCRWITPMMENCFAYCPLLQTLELDHTILHPLRPDNPLLRLFTICERPAYSTDPPAFPSLRFLKLKMVESALDLAQVQTAVSIKLGRPVLVKTRKLFLRLASRWICEEAALIRNWATFQRKRINDWLESAEARNLTAQERAEWAALDDDQLSIWNSGVDGSAMLILSFDAHDPQADPPTGPLGRNWETGHPDRLATEPIFYGEGVAKVTLKHFTPTNPLHAAVLQGLRFATPTSEMVAEGTKGGLHSSPSLATLDTSDDANEVERRQPLKRVTVQLDLPQVWQVTEEEAKSSVVAEIAALRSLILSHPDLSKALEARVMSCTRLTYGGSNWGWWEELICGKLRKREKTVEVEGWARESAQIITPEQLRVYKCDHIWTRSE